MSYTNKTQPTQVSPEEYLKENFKGKESTQTTALKLIGLYSKATGFPCVMWNKIFGFGKYTYLDSKGGKHEFLITGFAVSSTGFTLYNMLGWKTFSTEIKNLGKFKLSGGSCLKIKNLEDVDQKLLMSIIKKSFTATQKKYKT
ncbi:MAG: DUF1801 domain-containing protein [Candidatus Doudnabacteria bacterium]|nr:DUF1801 domain-containing protein [Candidatus Doudnabacteria bacterium]